MHKELKTIGFAAVICLVCSLLLSIAYSSLKPRQDANKALDLRIKVLQAFGVEVVDVRGKKLMSDAEIKRYFEERIVGHVLDNQGVLQPDLHVETIKPEQINDRDRASKLKKYYPFFEYTTDDGRKLYAIHVSGMGLWSICKGYMALESDFSTIAGLAFYEHAETPGLGGEIEKPLFQDQFKGKLLMKNGEQAYFRVLRPSDPIDESSVHGPSGSTMTSKGITAFVNSDFAVYNKYFQTLKAQGG